MPEQFLGLTRSSASVSSAPSSPAAPPVARPIAPTGSPAAVSVATPPGAPPAATMAPPATSGTRRSLVIGGIIAAAVLVLGGIAAFFVLRSVPKPPPAAAPRPAPTPVVNTPPPANVAPVNDPAPPPSTPLEPPPAPEPAPQPPASNSQLPDVDTDADGLTDAEEIVLGTNVQARDTDGDGYDDRTELLNLYNPVAVAPQRLIDSGAVFAYAHPTDAWEVYLPKSWTIAATDQEQREIVVTTGAAGETIVLRNIGTTVHGTECATVTTKRGEDGCRAVGEPVVFFTLSAGEFLQVRHDNATPPVRYPTLFEMVVQSFAGPPRGGPIE